MMTMILSMVMMMVILMVMMTIKIIILIANMFTATIRVMKINLSKLATLLVTLVWHQNLQNHVLQLELTENVPQKDNLFYIELSYLKSSRNYTISQFNPILAYISLAISLALTLIHIDVELLYLLSFIFFYLDFVCISLASLTLKRLTNQTRKLAHQNLTLQFKTANSD